MRDASHEMDERARAIVLSRDDWTIVQSLTRRLGASPHPIQSYRQTWALASIGHVVAAALVREGAR